MLKSLPVNIIGAFVRFIDKDWERELVEYNCQKVYCLGQF